MAWKTCAAAVIALALTTPVFAEEFETIRQEAAFLELVRGKQLTRLGIKLDVLPTGQIEGRAFGKDVTGAWRWANGYFCRDLYFGDEDLGPNCQVVKVRGSTLRFIADEGVGDYADLRLR